jgi:hypothetical protein
MDNPCTRSRDDKVVGANRPTAHQTKAGGLKDTGAEHDLKVLRRQWNHRSIQALIPQAPVGPDEAPVNREL